MKPLVIAGNGPSLAEVDYRLLPNDFDVFRCNQFYFEDKYYLGNNIKGVFFNPSVAIECLFTFIKLVQNNEYHIENFYCSSIDAGLTGIRSDGSGYKFMKRFFPYVDYYSDYLEKMPQFKSLHSKFTRSHPNSSFTSGVAMLIVGLSLGYKEVYIAGIDLYSDGAKYAFDTNRGNITSLIPSLKDENYINRNHSEEMDSEAIKMAISYLKERDNGFIYSVCRNSPVNKYLQLAPPASNRSIFLIPEVKNGSSISDIMPISYTPEEATSFGSALRARVMFFLKKNNLYDRYVSLSRTFIFRCLRDVFEVVSFLSYLVHRLICNIKSRCSRG